jgi:mannose-6-phosphate isomerase-like protein (cupin superfamily)
MIGPGDSRVPIFTRETLQTEKLPWMDIDDFEFIVMGRPPAQGRPSVPDSPAGNSHTPYWGANGITPDPHIREFKPTTPRERLVVLDGEVSVECELGRFTLKRRDFVEVPQRGATVTNVGTSTAELARVAGHWSRIIRNEICLFRPDRPCDYHYHDGDEYWMVFRGHFTLNYDGQEYALRPGLMLAAGMGYEHGSVNPEEHFEAVVMAMQLEGQGRDGHLLREMHGAPVKNRAVPDAAMQPHRKAALQRA